MIYEETISGRYVSLKSATIEDAEFTLALRQNPALTKYLPRLDLNVEQQKQWIALQREKLGDYFFVVRNMNDQPIGTVSVYEINGDTSESGRLALIGDALENTEATMLLFEFAFNVLRIKKITGYILDGNKRAERFNRQFGCLIGETEKEKNGKMIRKTLITAESFQKAGEKLRRILYIEK